MPEYVNFCKCEGFDEITVLAVKSVFTSRDIKELLIVKDDGRIVYHSRDCNDVVDVDNVANISLECKHWFNIILVNMQTQRIEGELIEGRIKFEDYSDELETRTNIVQGPVYKACPEKAAPQDIKLNAEKHIKETELNSFHKDYTLTKVMEGLKVKNRSVVHLQGESILKLNKHGHDYYAKVDAELEEMPADDDDVINASTENDAIFASQADNYAIDELVDDLSVEVGDECSANLREKNTKLRKPLRNKNSAVKSTKPKRKEKNSTSEEQKCTVCDKVFAKKGSLTRHQRTHSRGIKECTVCNQKVKDLTKHMKYKHIDKDKLCYFCDVCGRGFKDSGAYSYHKSGHTGDRNYSCSTCNKHYRNSSEQKKCERGHLGIFKYSCSSCGYRTHQKNKFTRHSRVHNKEAPFTCPICFLSLARKDYLQKHVIKKHNDHKLLDLEDKFPGMYEAKNNTESATQHIVNETGLYINKDVTVFVISS